MNDGASNTKYRNPSKRDGALARIRDVEFVGRALRNLAGRGAIGIEHRSDGPVATFRDDLRFAEVFRHPFKIHVRKSGANWQYGISEETPDSGIAGRVYDPLNTSADVTRVGWTTFTTTTSFWIKFVVDEGSVVVTIVTAAPSNSIVNDPATLSLFIGTITVTDGVPTSILQAWHSDVSFVGLPIPAFYPGYKKSDIDQILVHLKNSFLSWFVADTQTYERIPKWSTANALGTLNAYTSSSYHAHVETDNNTFYIEYEYDCDDNQA